MWTISSRMPWPFRTSRRQIGQQPLVSELLGQPPHYLFASELIKEFLPAQAIQGLYLNLFS